MCKNCIQIQLVLLLFLLFVATLASACLPHIQKGSTTCILPAHPKNGYYEVAGYPSAERGEEFEAVYLNVSCDLGYGVVGNNVVICVYGEWSTTMPECLPSCYLQQHASVKYSCNRRGTEGFGPCGDYEPQETSVMTECQPGYFSREAMPQMRCVDGTWSSVVTECTPDCGRMSTDGAILPWQVNIYEYKIMKEPAMSDTLQQLCGGTILTSNIIITAAHCFSDVPTDSLLVVVAGKTSLRVTPDDKKFQVTDIHGHEHFMGLKSNLQADIALVSLHEHMKFSQKIHPICLDFSNSLKKNQMKDGNFGTLAVMDTDGLIHIQKIPYIPIPKCIKMSSPSFIPYITEDKFCAGRENDTQISQGNSGSGLAFPEEEDGVIRYYLRGIVSASPRRDFIALTDVFSHKHFIMENLEISST